MKNKTLKIILIYLLLKYLENKFIFPENENNYKWKILYFLYKLNFITDFPVIFITHLLLTFFYIKKLKKKLNKKIFLIFLILPIIFFLIKYFLKNIFSIPRPYHQYLLQNHYKIINLPHWIINYWKKNDNYSFPSGHTIFISYWFFLLKKKLIKTKLLNIIFNFLFFLIIISRILLYLHKSEDIIFSILINYFILKLLNIKII